MIIFLQVVASLVLYAMIGSMFTFAFMRVMHKQRVHDEHGFHLVATLIWIGWPIALVVALPIVGFYRLFCLMDEKARELSQPKNKR